MKNFNPPKYTTIFYLLLVILEFTIRNVNAQDFILTKDNELIRCKITIDSPNYIQYIRKDGRIVVRPKSLVADHANVSKRKANVLEITDKQGLVLRGTFLFADQDSVYFWRGSKVYHPKKGVFLAVGINEIDKMVILRKGAFWKGFGIGSVAGISIGTIAAATDNSGWFGPLEIILTSTASYGLTGGVIGALTRKRFQFEDPVNALSEIQRLTRKNALLSTPPIKSIGRDTLKTNWVSNKKSLFKSKNK